MADDKQTDSKINEQILQLNTDAGLANYASHEPKRQFIDGLTRQQEGKDNGGYDSAIESFFGTGKNLYIQYKIAKKNQINLLMQITESNTDQYRQIKALKNLARKENNLVIYATTKIENSNDFKLKVENGESFEHIWVFDVKEIDIDIDSNRSIELSNDKFKLLNTFISDNLVTTSSSGGKAFSNSDFVFAIKEQFNLIDDSEIEQIDRDLYQFLQNELENAKKVEQDDVMFIFFLQLINKYTNCQICWVTEKDIYPANVIIQKCAELKRIYNYRLELQNRLAKEKVIEKKNRFNRSR